MVAVVRYLKSCHLVGPVSSGGLRQIGLRKEKSVYVITGSEIRMNFCVGREPLVPGSI